MSWLETSLKRYVAANAAQAKPRNVAEEREHFSAEYAALKAHMLKASRSAPSSSTLIPRFYFKPPRDDQILHQKLREEARAAFLQRKSAPTARQRRINSKPSGPFSRSTAAERENSTTKKMTDYFMRAAATATPKARRHFTSITFAKLLEKDTIKFFNYVMRKVWASPNPHRSQSLRRRRSRLPARVGLGELHIRAHTQLDCLEKSFYSFYVCTAVRKSSSFSIRFGQVA